ncbi:MAG TPA: 2-oxo acid dehydrogenase subunit E2 [Steroidobacteraceae bacterium]|nr:2-oxo acid dehydrogenase subunit E2 [Steroidobacteraceae bacterium]
MAATPLSVLVPDIGGFKDVDVIDVLVKDGQRIDKETPLITLETDKASMDVPSPAAGRIAQIRVKQGDKVSEGSLILLLESDDQAAEAPAPPAPAAASKPVLETKAAPDVPRPAPEAARPAAPEARPAAPQAKPAPVTATEATPATGDGARPSAVDESAFSKAYASPSVRKLARELGADLGKVKGTGPKSRITHEDVKAHVKALLTKPAAAPTGGAIPQVARVDFAAYGPVEVRPLSRIQRISGARLQASWLNLPHVTQHEDADITDMEIARVALKGKATQEGVRLTPLAFIIKACIVALKEFPRFNASLDAAGENLVLKKYFHIGFAADTPNGLVVPVIRDADRCNLFDIARSLSVLSEKARAGKLSAAEMQGGSFTISSLGGIGGTAFTPIINAPEVAILGVSRSAQKPVFDKGAFVPRLMLPLSLSYDHRVIDGAEAVRFIVFLSQTLGDVKAML